MDLKRIAEPTETDYARIEKYEMALHYLSGTDSEKDDFIDINIGAAVEKYFDDSSLSKAANPTFVLLMGGICVGKTCLRRQKYTKGFVVLDAAEIFLDLCNGAYFELGEAYEDALQLIGGLIAIRAIRERRNIVTEIVGATADDVTSILDLMKSAGYTLDLQLMECDRDVAWERNVNRGIDNISSHYTEPYHLRWLTYAVKKTQIKES
jgi:hypothetical protein